ncbi:hypothetical protein DPEC_G00307550 [Dallia pectoralis]|uniref:Uncharacterized protein n=1 Tax=Dallia pectoralis TaxID=75939 RepID=A0ACC2FEE1_DALPE|nr:hypothetical protein DPEC_G00307550 [Dallia pectoralis]
MEEERTSQTEKESASGRQWGQMVEFVHLAHFHLPSSPSSLIPNSPCTERTHPLYRRSSFLSPVGRHAEK